MLLRVTLCAVVALGLGAGPAAAVATAAAAATAPAATRAAPRTGQAEVREGAGGVPCFTIAEAEERRSGARRFQAVSVADVSGPARAIVWAMAMPPERTFPLMFSMCVPYGGRVAALPQRSAELLEAGKLYEVAIEVRPGEAVAEAPTAAPPARAIHAAGPRTAPSTATLTAPLTTPLTTPTSYTARFCLRRRADGSNAVMTGAAACPKSGERSPAAGKR